MKKILYFIIGAMLLTSCEDFLDSSNKTKKDSSNFPQTEADVSQLLTGVYSILGRPEPLGSLFFVSELMSDDRLGGGGTDDKSCKAIDQFKKDGDDTFNNPWRAMYFGVYRSTAHGDHDDHWAALSAAGYELKTAARRMEQLYDKLGGHA